MNWKRLPAYITGSVDQEFLLRNEVRRFKAANVHWPSCDRPDDRGVGNPLCSGESQWGYRQIVGALGNLGHEISHQIVANVLQRHGLAPARERGKKTLWQDFVRSHLETLAAVDFFTAEVWTASGLLTSYMQVFMRIAPRQVCIAGLTPSPDVSWRKQMARNMTMAGEVRKGFSIPSRSGMKEALSAASMLSIIRIS